MMVTEDATRTRLDGRVVGIAGPVIDVEFPRGSLPEINTALEFDIVVDGTPSPVLAEVAQQLGEGRVRGVHETDRRPDPRHGRAQHGQGHHRAGR